jgi:hypothetical protein
MPNQPDLNVSSYFDDAERECRSEINRWREPGNVDLWPIERERVPRLLREATRLSDEISGGGFDQTYCARVKARLELLKKDWEMVCQARAILRPVNSTGQRPGGWTPKIARKFVSDYIKAERQAGRTPTQDGMLKVVHSQNRRGGRDFLRKTFKDHMRRLGYRVERGRPKKQIPKIRGN